MYILNVCSYWLKVLVESSTSKYVLSDNLNQSDSFSLKSKRGDEVKKKLLWRFFYHSFLSWNITSPGIFSKGEWFYYWVRPKVWWKMLETVSHLRNNFFNLSFTDLRAHLKEIFGMLKSFLACLFSEKIWFRHFWVLGRRNGQGKIYAWSTEW